MKSKDTKPEVKLRQELKSLGIGYRLHRRDLPGTPDLAFIGFKLAVFVHGCYWHRHNACEKQNIKSISDKVWATKFNSIVKNDHNVKKQFEIMGWNHMVIWECEINKNAFLQALKIQKRLQRLAAQ